MTTSVEDSELRHKVLAELEWDPRIDASGIAVLAANGVVTLTGTVGSYFEKRNAEAAVKRVAGVKAVAEELHIRLGGAVERTDSDIAQAVLNGLRFNVAVPDEFLKVIVEDGWVTLEGDVEWQFQKDAAEHSVKYLMGVKGVTDRIRVRPRLMATDVKGQIESAFARRAELEADRIKVQADGDTVTLRGIVKTFVARDEAERAAWLATGVAKVHNDIVVSP